MAKFSETQLSYDAELLGQRICRLRKAAGLTQEALAEKINISVAGLSRIENGHSGCTLNNLAAMAELFNVELADLISGVVNTGKSGQEYSLGEFAEILAQLPADSRRLLYRIAQAVLSEEQVGGSRKE